VKSSRNKAEPIQVPTNSQERPKNRPLTVVLKLCFLCIRSVELALALAPIWYFRNNLGLLFHLNTFTSVVAAAIVGLVMAIIGRVMLDKISGWQGSVSFVVGHIMGPNRWPTLLKKVLLGNFAEEMFTRGVLLICLDKYGLGSVTAAIWLAIHVIWTIGHIGNRQENLLAAPKATVQKCLPHLAVILASSIPLSALAIIFSSVIHPLLAHYALNISFAWFYRRYLALKPSEQHYLQH